jgi:hypothetical protein
MYLISNVFNANFRKKNSENKTVGDIREVISLVQQLSSHEISWEIDTILHMSVSKLGQTRDK